MSCLFFWKSEWKTKEHETATLSTSGAEQQWPLLMHCGCLARLPPIKQEVKENGWKERKKEGVKKKERKILEIDT